VKPWSNLCGAWSGREDFDHPHPSWRQLAAIPESTTKSAILRALAIQPPPEGVSDTFDSGGTYAQRVESGFVLHLRPPRRRSAAIGFQTAGELLRAAKVPAGTPTGDAFRAWLRRWGWVPKGEQAPNADTRTVI
jgi:hypothetical protein